MKHARNLTQYIINSNKPSSTAEVPQEDMYVALSPEAMPFRTVFRENDEISPKMWEA